MAGSPRFLFLPLAAVMAVASYAATAAVCTVGRCWSFARAAAALVASSVAWLVARMPRMVRAGFWRDWIRVQAQQLRRVPTLLKRRPMISTRWRFAPSV